LVSYLAQFFKRRQIRRTTAATNTAPQEGIDSIAACQSTHASVVQDLRWFVDGFRRVVESRDKDFTDNVNPEKLIYRSSGLSAKYFQTDN